MRTKTVERISASKKPEFFEKDSYDFQRVREQELVEEYSRAWRDAGTQHMNTGMFPDEKKKQAALARFLLKCFHADAEAAGKIVIGLQNRDTDYLCFAAEACKNMPKRKSTVNLAEQIRNFASAQDGDLHLKTCTFYHSKYHTYDADSIKICCMLVVDIDNCSELYSCPETEWENFVMEKYPIFQKFQPTYLLSSGNKGFHAIYAFDSNIYEKSGIALMANRLLAALCDGDMVRTGIYNSTRIPFSVNGNTGREVKIFYENKVHDYAEFKRDLFAFAENMLLAKRDADAPELNEESYRGLAGQIQYTRDICEHFLSDELTEEIAEENYCTVETLMDSYIRRYGRPKEKNQQPVEDRKAFLKHVPLTSLRRPSNENMEQNYHSWSSMLHDEAIPLYLRARFFDIHKNIDENAGNMLGYRSNTITVVANTLRLMGCSRGFCNYMMHYYNNKFTTPLRESELKATLKYQYRKLTFISNEKMADMLGLSDRIMRSSLISYTSEQKLKKEEAYKQKLLEERRKQRGAAQRLRLRLSCLAHALEECSTIAEAVTKTGYSRSNIYRLMKEYTFLADVRNGKMEINEAEKLIQDFAEAKRTGRTGFADWKAGRGFSPVEELEDNDTDNDDTVLDEYGYDIRIPKNCGVYAEADKKAFAESRPCAGPEIIDDRDCSELHRMREGTGTASRGLPPLEDFVKEVSAAMERGVQKTLQRFHEQEQAGFNERQAVFA